MFHKVIKIFVQASLRAGKEEFIAQDASLVGEKIMSTKTLYEN
jgi:hypothetical protein